jgi:hypothetical protein
MQSENRKSSHRRAHLIFWHATPITIDEQARRRTTHKISRFSPHSPVESFRILSSLDSYAQNLVELSLRLGFKPLRHRDTGRQSRNEKILHRSDHGSNGFHGFRHRAQAILGGEKILAQRPPSSQRENQNQDAEPQPKDFNRRKRSKRRKRKFCQDEQFSWMALQRRQTHFWPPGVADLATSLKTA